MQHDMVAKLTAELSQPIGSERQVVYILVELRKLLELTGTLGNYQTLKLCCDWAVHPKLDKQAAQRIVSLFDAYEARNRRERLGVQQANMPELSGFLQHNLFRREMIAACESNQVPKESILDDDWWRSFLVHYTEVVRDCPIEARADNTTYVARVMAHAVTEGLTAVIMPTRQFGIQWTWYFKGEDRSDHVMAFF